MKKVFVNILSNSLGDTIATIPYVSEYQKVNDFDVTFSINDRFIFLFESSYDNIKLVGRKDSVTYDEIINLKYDFSKSIQGGYAEQLGFENPKYIRPIIDLPKYSRTIKNKYVILGIHSTSQLKYWNHPDGVNSQMKSPYWNELSSMLRKSGYTPITIEKDELFGVAPHRNGLPSKANNKIGTSLFDSINLINHCEFFIGLSSGMAWLAHALGKKVAMISNFTEDWTEFDLSLDDYVRITNKTVCHGCWNKINSEHLFDPYDWYWCPLHRDTDRQFECHKSITTNDVMDKIKHWI
jgi:autotransporter strand-loop-strand O-heptosyltransferase